LDVGLSQAVLGLKSGKWINNPLKQFVNKGELVEAFVGQELHAYSRPLQTIELYYWHKETRDQSAEIDYLIQGDVDTEDETAILPIEVKSGLGTTLKSLHTFLEKHPESPLGIKFSTQNYSVHGKIHSYPLYAIAAMVKQYWK